MVRPLSDEEIERFRLHSMLMTVPPSTDDTISDLSSGERGILPQGQRRAFTPVIIGGFIKKNSDGLAVQGSIAQFWDRNAVGKNAEYYATSVTAHGTAERFSYTVPTDKLFMLGQVYMGFCVDTALDSSSRVQMIMRTTLNDVTKMGIVLFSEDAAAVGVKQLKSAAGGAVMQVGARVTADTNIAGTGGTVSLVESYLGTEFDV